MSVNVKYEKLWLGRDKASRVPQGHLAYCPDSLLCNRLESIVHARECNDAAALRQKAEVVRRSLIAPGIFEGQRPFVTKNENPMFKGTKTTLLEHFDMITSLVSLG